MINFSSFCRVLYRTINNLVYVGLTFNTADLGGNDYVSFFLSGLVEIPAYLLCIPLIGSFLGRKWSTSILEIIGGVACICTILIRKWHVYC